MKKSISLLTITLILCTVAAFSQTSFKDVKAGNVFHIDLPEYMAKTRGLNSDAELQFKNAVKDVYGIVIEDTKENLKLAELNFASIKEFYEFSNKNFLKDAEQKEISKPTSKTIGDINFIAFDASCYDTEAKTKIYYFTGIVETKSCFYKVLCWTALQNKDTFKPDFEKILYSLKD
ncbi:hypothetical protein ABIB40_002149 [Pedobacter sp. UYP30]|uniref:hypothetical protein n=1 Tax=Pedobacter sp. UYP30 TaxID=1756400 RepID=UPI00339A3A28